ncbi:rRNA biogenesis protein [Wickerhamomyces ciferrii]|uniref:rRNA biogenesis protein RRP5 n=1 Tax=Wickerhamomyces ciferrii (strain ATCC 14091 / BCRC 22168 / CBS 111 / JCM 3599 / NBRC 0793 / NRRL Y-1031 F-60-10) TaxID=1206466 RepID=K0KVL3_WICCF|nr:rRNA biogenesis protein [Wickerhamomyces ciferrii]CCH45514.1 rRNA biogenesis protein [Wickerhamomyces ciferrii]
MVVSKRRRSDADSKKKESPLVREDATKAPQKSILEQSEVSFPRGGASALTPLELKEVANEAAGDVLFGKESSGASQPSTKSDDQRPLKKKKTSKVSKTQDSNDKPSVKIESLNFKSLQPGTSVLGQILEINRLDLALALPDNLIGYVPITSISSSITKQLEDFEESDSEDEDEDESEDEEQDEENKTTKGTLKTKESKEFPQLSKFFKIGQWLRAVVVESTQKGKKKQNKKRIQLSVEIETTNKDLEDDDLVAGTTLQVSVKSVEDHGLILDTGREGLGGFISNKELKNANYDSTAIVPGTVFLSTVVNKNARTVTVKLNTGKKNPVTTTSSIDSIVPGNYIETLITEVHQDGLATKTYGLVDSSINLTHLGTYSAEEIKHKYAIGSNIKARVIAVILSNGAKKLVLSVLPHVLNLNETNYDTEVSSAPLDAFPLGHIFESVEVKGYDSNYIYVKIGGDRYGQAHTSRADTTAGLSITYTIGSQHKARVLGFSQLDNSYVLTMDPKVIEQKYLKAQDLPLGEKVNGEVISVSEDSMKIKIFKQFEAVVPAAHMSDVKLIYPERKFKIGSKVRGRIINISKYTSEITVTLKKSLVGIENVITKIDDAKVGERTSVTVTSFRPSGALVSFFGNLKAFLPKSEISETFVKKPEDHLRLGQTITVRIASVNKETHRISVSCRLSEETTEEQQQALEQLVVGRSILKVEIVEKSKESVIVEIPGNNLRGVIFEGHLSDGNFEQNRAILKRLEVGSSIEGLVLDKDSRSRLFNLTAKKSLITAAQEDKLPVKFSDISISEQLIPGYVKSVTNKGIFVAFGAKLVGLILAKYATSRPVDDLSSVFHVNQSVSVRVIRTDEEHNRFLLSLKEKKTTSDDIVNPVDQTIKSAKEFVPGKLTKALIKSVKQSQLNVQLADNIQGRVDVSQIYETYDEIKNPKVPLAPFKKGDIIDVKVIGFHDARNHRFLPISHRRSKQILIELSAKKSDLTEGTTEALSFDKLTVGTEWVAFINNATVGFFFLNLSPSIKGRISFMDLPGDASALKDLDGNYPIGSALKVKVKAVDAENHNVLLTGRQDSISTIEDVKVGAVVPSRILRITESFVIVELAENVTAMSFITDALDDYSKKLEDVFEKNEILPAKILSVDEHNKKLNVSLRSNDAKDKLISKSDDLKRGDVVHGFVKNISDKGLFISLGRTVTGYVKVSDVSDSFIKAWKKYYKPHQQVIGKIINADTEGNVTLTLKESEVNGELNILKRFEDIVIGDIFEGSVRRVTDFGVFVKLDGTLNISGLCHHSQIADNDVTDLEALFGEGDRVKVKVLAVDTGKKQLSLGMKASYFIENADEDEDVDMEDASEENVEEDSDSEEADDKQDSEDEAEEDAIVEDAFNEQDSEESSDEEEEESKEDKSITGLTTNGFDWTASILDQVHDDESSDEEDFTDSKSKKKRKTKEVVEDTTGDLQSKAPQSVSDFERLIIGNPNSSIVWMNYMSFQLQLSEIEKAREIAERALKTINYREEQEKLNIWIALLNLENTFGTKETLEDAFKRSTEYMDSLVMHQKLVSIYILSEKFSKAESLFKVITKKFGKESVSVWVSYGSYLLDQNQSDKAHEVLASSLNSLPKRDHIEVVRKFAQLEFTKGDAEQGRTLFEGLIADVPKRIDLWNVYIDQEIKKNENKKVSDLFERVLSRKVSRKQAKFFFGKWLSFAEKQGDTKTADYVKAKAQEYVQKNKE